MDNLLKFHGNLLNMLDKQVHILINYFLQQICWFIILINYSLKIMQLLHGNYFFIMQSNKILQKLCVPHKTHKWAADCEPLDSMISL
jgi:hypothetical protein